MKHRNDFWNRVYFGNYVDVLCGIQDGKAKAVITADNNREKFNDSLFRFINDNNIQTVFIFSRLVYDYFPEFNTEAERLSSIPCESFTNDRTDRIYHCKYKADTDHEKATVQLKCDLEVYDMLHPSGQYGFDPKHYKEALTGKIPLEKT